MNDLIMMFEFAETWHDCPGPGPTELPKVESLAEGECIVILVFV